MAEPCENPGNCKVVLVEDDPMLATVLAMQMQAAGINFCAASDGHQALSLIHLHCPQVLILDLTIPGLNGFEIVESLRRDPFFVDFQTMNVIVYSSQDLTEPERQSLSSLGKTIFITKSVKDEGMGNIVKQLLSIAD